MTVVVVVVVWSLSCVWHFATPWTAALQASLSITISCPLNWWTHSIISFLCLTLFLLPSIFPSIRVFSNESALCIRWPKHWSFSFSISPSSEYSGLISFRIDWSHLLADQIHYSNNWIVYLFIQSIAIEFPIKCQALF